MVFELKYFIIYMRSSRAPLLREVAACPSALAMYLTPRAPGAREDPITPSLLGFYNPRLIGGGNQLIPCHPEHLLADGSRFGPAVQKASTTYAAAKARTA